MSTSIWPRLAFGYDHPSRPTSTVAGDTAQNLTIQFYVPVVYQFVSHFFIGGGPSFDLSLTSDGNQYGLDIILGGWI